VRSSFKALFQPRVYRHVARLEGVLGTALEVQIAASSKAVALGAQAALLAEIDRLEQIFSRFRPESELNRWQGTLNEDVLVSPDLEWLLAQSLNWQTRSKGAFHPGADALSALWREAMLQGRQPSTSRIAETLEGLRRPLYRVSRQHGTARKLSGSTLNFNAFAKGRIVDCACIAAQNGMGVSGVLVNIGGDLRHAGATGVTVDIADAMRKTDNLPPVAQVQIQNQGVATSGGAHRGFQIGTDYFSHVIDPRSGFPVRQVVGASVIAPDSATADVLATIFSVLEPHESLELADDLGGIGCRVVTQANEVVSNVFWRQHESM
jgi:FAD:protein FMN transferase